MKHVLTICIAGGLFLCGCATTAPAPPVSAPSVVCLPVVNYDAATEKKMAAELALLPPDDVLVSAMTDYGATRAALRACYSSGK